MLNFFDKLAKSRCCNATQRTDAIRLLGPYDSTVRCDHADAYFMVQISSDRRYVLNDSFDYQWFLLYPSPTGLVRELLVGKNKLCLTLTADEIKVFKSRLATEPFLLGKQNASSSTAQQLFTVECDVTPPGSTKSYTSRRAELHILDVPRIIAEDWIDRIIAQQPRSMSVFDTCPAQLEVHLRNPKCSACLRELLHCQWYRNGVAISGETKTTLSVASVQNDTVGVYTCEVSHCGEVVATTAEAALRILEEPPTIHFEEESIPEGGHNPQQPQPQQQPQQPQEEDDDEEEEEEEEQQQAIDVPAFCSRSERPSKTLQKMAGMGQEFLEEVSFITLKSPVSFALRGLPLPANRAVSSRTEGAECVGDAPRGGAECAGDAPRGGAECAGDAPCGGAECAGDAPRGGAECAGDAPRGGAECAGDAPRGGAECAGDGDAPRVGAECAGDAPRGGDAGTRATAAKQSLHLDGSACSNRSLLRSEKWDGISNVKVNVTVTGATAHQWYKDTAPIKGATGTFLELFADDIDDAPGAHYYYIGSNQFGEVESERIEFDKEVSPRPLKPRCPAAVECAWEGWDTELRVPSPPAGLEYMWFVRMASRHSINDATKWNALSTRSSSSQRGTFLPLSDSFLPRSLLDSLPSEMTLEYRYAVADEHGQGAISAVGRIQVDIRCLICREEQSQSGPLQVMRECCGETFCVACLQQYLSHCIEKCDQVAVRCPGSKCKQLMGWSSVKLHATEATFERYVGAHRRQHLDRLNDTDGHNSDFWKWACSGDLAACPVCSILIQRSQGCNHMHCTSCLHDFNYDENLLTPARLKEMRQSRK
ncbi:hypothetical protein CYMTET_25981 [Cymbomonas tetramitiformis]|uniref:RING-type domain-containing protein n=1 Tax=Cymbomonas tetramitiformis TaxID=36881 RepID=A0AAE0KYB9_9CHLO|nr:hypothetical protein CYMTET_25981 [Cymbomonas tetramitiformis]